MNRHRPTRAALTLIVIGLGLASRSDAAATLPTFLCEYAGDTLWALMVFLGFGFLFPRWSTAGLAVAAAGFCFAIEFSQLWQHEWLNRLRDTRPGALVLGRGFLWSDLLCYSAGILIGATGEAIWKKARPA